MRCMSVGVCVCPCLSVYFHVILTEISAVFSFSLLAVHARRFWAGSDGGLVFEWLCSLSPSLVQIVESQTTPTHHSVQLHSTGQQGLEVWELEIQYEQSYLKETSIFL